jgi:hypothetical protein
MNSEQGKGQIRTWLIATAGIVVGVFSELGWVSDSAASALLTSPIMIGGATIVAGAIWSWFDKTTAAQAAKADALARTPGSGVQAVITENTPKGIELAAKIASPATAVAGTIKAEAITKV